jgi:hypothetical protein
MMMTTANDFQSKSTDSMAELSGPPQENPYWGYFQKDWINLCEDLKDRDRTVYGVLRSLVYEYRGTVNNVRLLSLSILCELIPGVNGKPTSLGNLRDSFRRLSKYGLISDPDGNPITTSSSAKAATKVLRIQIHDIPCNGYQPRWRNTDEKLAAIKAGWNSNQTDEEEQIGWNSNQSGCDSNQSGQNSNQDPMPEQGKLDPYFLSFPSSPTPPSETSAPDEAPAIPEIPVQGGGMATPKKTGDDQGALEYSAAAMALIAALPVKSGIELGKVTSDIVRLLEEGHELAVIREVLLKRWPRKVEDPTGLCRARLRRLSEGEDRDAVQATVTALVHPHAHAYVDDYGSCSTCGLPEANPRHRVAAAVPAA